MTFKVQEGFRVFHYFRELVQGGVRRFFDYIFTCFKNNRLSKAFFRAAFSSAFISGQPLIGNHTRNLRANIFIVINLITVSIFSLGGRASGETQRARRIGAFVDIILYPIIVLIAPWAAKIFFGPGSLTHLSS